MPYTNSEYQDLGLSPDEIQAMSDLGADINAGLSVTSAVNLAKLYLSAGLEDEAERVLQFIANVSGDPKTDPVAYIQNEVYNATGYAIGYNEEVNNYYYLAGQINAEGDNIGGQFLPYIEYDRTAPTDVRETSLKTQLGENPISP